MPAFIALGFSEAVAPAVPRRLQHGFWDGALASEKEVPLEGRFASTLAADDPFDDPADAAPGLGDEVRSLLGPEGPGDIGARIRALKLLT